MFLARNPLRRSFFNILYEVAALCFVVICGGASFAAPNEGELFGVGINLFEDFGSIGFGSGSPDTYREPFEAACEEVTAPGAALDSVLPGQARCSFC
jgi:hypothetical protein